MAESWIWVSPKRWILCAKFFSVRYCSIMSLSYSHVPTSSPPKDSTFAINNLKISHQKRQKWERFNEEFLTEGLRVRYLFTEIDPISVFLVSRKYRYVYGCSDVYDRFEKYFNGLLLHVFIECSWGRGNNFKVQYVLKSGLLFMEWFIEKCIKISIVPYIQLKVKFFLNMFFY
jgi:hypothetical protein